MLADRQIRNIALVGFMGAGKTTVGQIVAHLLKFEFKDTDRLIEAREGSRISDVFATRGEAYFREQERGVALELETLSHHVISTGGGFIVDPANLESLRRHALVVCLWASPETIFSRLQHQTHRPLLQTSDPLATIRELMQRRAPSYRNADHLVGVDFRSPADTARHIASNFSRSRNTSAREFSGVGALNPSCPPPAQSAISAPS